MSDKMQSGIGTTKEIDGKPYKKVAFRGCENCDIEGAICDNRKSSTISIEDGGVECIDAMWEVCSSIAAMWQPIETAPLHESVLFFREDAGVFYGQKTYCAEWVSEEEQEREGYDEGTLFQIDCWAFEHDGACRLEGDVTPTHWMPLPEAPQ